MMVKNFTNTNKTNIHHSPQTIEHMKGQDIWHWKSKICPDLLSLNKTTHYHKNE